MLLDLRKIELHLLHIERVGLEEHMLHPEEHDGLHEPGWTGVGRPSSATPLYDPDRLPAELLAAVR